MAPSTRVESSTSDFIFINHSAKRLKTIKDKNHRAVINQHVQKAWLKAKKPKAESLVLRPNATDSARILSIDDFTPGSEADPGHDSASIDDLRPWKHNTKPAIKSRAARAKKRLRQRSNDVFPIAAYNTLTHGNSDPFQTLTIDLDPTVSHLLHYSRDVMLPSIYSMEVRATTPSLGISRAWDHVMLAFQDECAISAYLAVAATSILRIAPSAELARVALRYNSRSSTLLRQRIEQNGDSLDPRMYIIVLWLSAHALANGDFNAGMIHAKTLCFLVKQAGGIAKLDPTRRDNILHFDVQFAIMFLRRPFFDANDYAPGSFNQAWLNDPEAVDRPSPENKLITFAPLTPTLTSAELISTVSELRELHAVFTFTLHNPVPGTSPILRWLYLQKHTVEARLLDFCCNRIYSPMNPPTPTPPPSDPSPVPSLQTSSSFSTSSPQQPEPGSGPSPSTPSSHNNTTTTTTPDNTEDPLLPALAIALVYWLAMSVGHSKQKIHACSTLLSHLRFLLSSCASNSTYTSPSPPSSTSGPSASASTSNPSASSGSPSASGGPSTIHLWTLYVGTLAEQALGAAQPDNAWRDWCTVRFVAGMRGMGITSAEGCRAVLEGVLFEERMHWEDAYDASDSRTRQRGERDLEELEGENLRRGKSGWENWWWRVERCFGGGAAAEYRRW